MNNRFRRFSTLILRGALVVRLALPASLVWASALKPNTSSAHYSELFNETAIVPALLRWEGTRAFHPAETIARVQEISRLQSEFGDDSVRWFSRFVLAPSRHPGTDTRDVPTEEELHAFKQLGWKLREEPSIFDYSF